MNGCQVATLRVLPDVAGWGQVEIGGVRRRCYIDRRLGTPIPVTGTRVMVATGAGDTLIALWWLGV